MELVPYRMTSEFEDILAGDKWKEIIEEVVEKNLATDEELRSVPDDLVVHCNKKLFLAAQLIQQRNAMQFFADMPDIEKKLIRALKTSIKFSMPQYIENQKQKEAQIKALAELNKIRSEIIQHAEGLVAAVDAGLKVMKKNRLNARSPHLPLESVFQLVDMNNDALAQRYAKNLLTHYKALNSRMGYGL